MKHQYSILAKPIRTSGGWHTVEGLFVLSLALSGLGFAAESELIGDSHFQNGFYLLDPKPGQRVVYDQLTGFNSAKPVWDLAQWSSRFPLYPGGCFSTKQSMAWTNNAKALVVGASDDPDADVSLAVNAGVEYSRARKSSV